MYVAKRSQHIGRQPLLFSNVFVDAKWTGPLTVSTQEDSTTHACLTTGLSV